ncbi:MAG TPA: T9SS type A sorting domain-containing protein [Paludibacteraceae bacterium]|nr:T9SS type A sorting domain-containing protein [Paludibacteraceae bacterium]HOS37228.1 T9SS type A sorting domain-containing protein [Paludibacteraceae bacterium]HPK20886.1 T9SS type A sorting domain-containing protein [Paludibacteraceae bacterium]
MKNEYTYNADGNWTLRVSCQWNSTTQKWIFSSKNENTYDANGYLIMDIFSRWNTTTQKWDTIFKYDYTNNANGNPILEICSLWNSTTQSWEYNDDSEKYENTYDANGNLISGISSDWNSSAGQWKYRDKDEYIYDLSYSFNNLIVPEWYNAINKLLEKTSYKYTEGNWVKDNTTDHYYSKVVTSVSYVSFKNYKVYPNPVSDIINIEVADGKSTFTFELYDSQGRKLISKELTNNGQISLEGLAKGFYVYNLINDGKTQSGKLIKNKTAE